MSENKAVGVRARVRAELTAEIKQAARRQLVTDGASALSLRAIARELGMASSAVYRYFASRDELLTALIVDAYNAAGQVVEDADAANDRAAHRARFAAIASALRGWAIENPHQWALIYGSPVPGYAAPEDTIDPATRVPTVLLTLLIEARIDDPARRRSKAEAAREADLGRAMADLVTFTGDSVPPSVLSQGVQVWAELVGIISLELFGHFNNVIPGLDAHFDHVVSTMTDQVLNP